MNNMISDDFIGKMMGAPWDGTLNQPHIHLMYIYICIVTIYWVPYPRTEVRISLVSMSTWQLSLLLDLWENDHQSTLSKKHVVYDILSMVVFGSPKRW